MNEWVGEEAGGRMSGWGMGGWMNTIKKDRLSPHVIGVRKVQMNRTSQ